MQIIKFTIFLLFILLNLNYSQNVNPNFDYSGIYKFYEIVDILQQNKEPNSNQWNTLFNTPGYKVLTSGEFTKNFFKKNFRLVFMPAKSKELSKALKNKKDLWHLTHFIKVRDNKEKMIEQLEKLKTKPFNRIAINKTLKYLPPNYVTQYPPVAFVIFENNGRGSSPIVVDLAASIEWDFVNFLSHEFHHWYRNRQLKFNYRNIKSEDIYLVQTLDHIEAEGIADMVDKKDWFTKASNSVSRYAREFINDVGRTPYVINQIDKILSQAEKIHNQRKDLGIRLSNILPQKGHTTGYFMASLILEEYGKDKLVKCLGNPFRFILTYHNAAKANGRYPSLSEASVKLLEDFENKYVQY